jgi:hypothetical protein
MTQQEISLLLQDLCARLPYEVKVSILGGGAMPLKNLINSSIGWYADVEGAPTDFSIDEIKPYLRPMSSMTDEEKSYVQQCIDIVEAENYGDSYSPAAWDAMSDFTNYCYERHLDLHGLIPKSLALNAPEGMYEIK